MQIETTYDYDKEAAEATTASGLDSHWWQRYIKEYERICNLLRPSLLATSDTSPATVIETLYNHLNFAKGLKDTFNFDTPDQREQVNAVMFAATLTVGSLRTAQEDPDPTVLERMLSQGHGDQDDSSVEDSTNQTKSDTPSDAA